MRVFFLPRPLWERVGERGLVDGASIVALQAAVTLSLTLSPRGRGDWLDRWSL
jgi:hypothetical protein